MDFALGLTQGHAMRRYTISRMGAWDDPHGCPTSGCSFRVTAKAPYGNPCARDGSRRAGKGVRYFRPEAFRRLGDRPQALPCRLGSELL